MNLSLEDQAVVRWDLSVILWPVFAGLCICLVIIMGIMLFTLGSFLSWVSEEISTKEFISTVWLLLTVSGVTSTILWLCVNVSSQKYSKLGEYYTLVPVCFLAFFIATTLLNINNLVDWWTMFFSQSNAGDSEVMPTTVPQVPASPSFPHRISQVVKKAPHLLMRISSSYFQPAETPKNKKLKKRTFSLKSNLGEAEDPNHRRIFSNPALADQSSALSPKAEPTSPQGEVSKTSLCSMCYENLSNAVLMDCGHGGICYECSLELWKAVGVCHMCRAPIAQVLQIELGLSRVVKVHSATRAVYYDNE